MAIRKIAQLGEPVLRQAAREVSHEELASPRIQALIDDMVETMRDADGAGLAAPQVYESVAIVVIEVRDNPRYPQAESIPLTVLVNPEVVPLVDPNQPENAVFLYEGCLSVTGLRGQVRRPRRVRVQAWDRTGHQLDFEWEGFRAVVVQHETDHLHGTLFVDRAEPKTLTFLREYDRFVPPVTRFIDGGRP